MSASDFFCHFILLFKNVPLSRYHFRHKNKHVLVGIYFANCFIRPSLIDIFTFNNYTWSV
jgi:hypothetical protein